MSSTQQKKRAHKSNYWIARYSQKTVLSFAITLCNIEVRVDPVGALVQIMGETLLFCNKKTSHSLLLLISHRCVYSFSIIAIRDWNRFPFGESILESINRD